MADDAPDAAEEKKSKKKVLLIPIVVLVLGIAGGGYFFFSSKSNAKTDETTTTTIGHGKIVRLKPLTLNLSDGHVLKVGIALQLVTEPKDEHLAALLGGGGGHGGGASTEVAESPLDGLEAKALDEAIHTLGDSTIDELSKPGGRHHAKEVLSEKIKEIYHGDVVEVYFTDFVMS